MKISSEKVYAICYFICVAVLLLVLGQVCDAAHGSIGLQNTRKKSLPLDTVRRSESIIRANALTVAEPDRSAAGRMKGTVRVNIVINEMGAVIYAKASTGKSPLKVLAVTAARKSVFRPALDHGVPVKVYSVLTYRF